MSVNFHEYLTNFREPQKTQTKESCVKTLEDEHSFEKTLFSRGWFVF